MINGIAASPGLVMGKVLVIKDEKAAISKLRVEDTKAELARLQTAFTEADRQMTALIERTTERLGAKNAEILEAHLMILHDVEFVEQITGMIQSEQMNAEWAIKTAADALVLMFSEMDDEYMRERAADIKDVSSLLTDVLCGNVKTDLSRLDEHVILAAYDFMPSDTAKMDQDKVLAFLSQFGGKTSHSAIMAKSLGIPAVVGVGGLMESVKNGDTAIINGNSGMIIINPNEEEIVSFSHQKAEEDGRNDTLKALVDAESVTKDGFKVEIAANIGSVNDIGAVLKNGADGVGLLRSEFLYMERSAWPTEDEQAQAYGEVAAKLQGKPLIIRTLDIGGDKELSYLNTPKEDNPFLGYRAIRLCLDREEIFRTQLRAILRASHCGKVRIMFPMISCLEELRRAKALLADEMENLAASGIAFDRDMEIGMMIEIPAAAIISDVLAKEVDFFSIGTNDLIQYTVAVDRMNSKIAHLYDQYHPGVLRLVKLVIDNAAKEGCWVGMCGEAASDTRLIPLFIGMGMNELSMSAGSILKARDKVRGLSKKELEKYVADCLSLATGSEVKAFLDTMGK